MKDQHTALINAIVMTMGKLFYLLSFCCFLMFLFSKNSIYQNKILGSSVFCYLSRLLYCTFLVFPIICKAFVASLSPSYQVNLTSTIANYFFNITVSFCLGFFLHVLVEKPLYDLTKFLTPL
mmetsp:Transcript_26296/g.25468  ORF Transcript_26296/g.25468 Transcript_26296/m.25468 type:complete len:122 (+) Transcript_26296:1123-1488(+)